MTETPENESAIVLVNDDGDILTPEQFNTTEASEIDTSPQMLEAIADFRRSLSPLQAIFENSKIFEVNAVAIHDGQYNFSIDDIRLGNAYQEMIDKNLALTQVELNFIKKISAYLFCQDRGFIQSIAEKDGEGNLIFIQAGDAKITTKDLVSIRKEAEKIGKAYRFAIN